jgi:hypothetical protein
MKGNKSIFHILFAILICLLYLAFSKEIPFFWDSIQLSSKQAHYFYENGFSTILLPQEIDSGHPPFVGLYLASFWTLFGKSLLVSHLAFTPFVVLYVFIVSKFASTFLKDKHLQILWILVMLTEPLFLSQSFIMSPDIILASALMSLVYGFLVHNKKWMFVGAILVALVSMRGAMVIFSCLMYLGWKLFYLKELTFKKAIADYWPVFSGAFVFFIFLLLHFFDKKWIGFHTESPWAESFQTVGISGLVRNLAIFLYRWIESGKLIVLFCVTFLLVFNKKKMTKIQSDLCLLLLLVTGVILINTIPYSHLSANRYFWPIYILSLLLIALFLDEKTYSRTLKLTILILIFVNQTVIHFVDFRPSYSHDWELSLIHLPYHNLRNQALDYLYSRDLSPEQVGSSFPAVNSDKHISLTDDAGSIQLMAISQDSFILYSNVMNGVKKADLALIRNNYEAIWSQKSGRIEMIIYKKK